MKHVARLSLILLLAFAPFTPGKARAGEMTVREVITILRTAQRTSTVADLHGRDLSRLDLADLNLSGADLSGANLFGADLTGARLEHVRF